MLQEQQEPNWRRSTVAAGEDFCRAYGMYLIRYVFVTWLQFVLLSAPRSGAAKGSIVLLGTLAPHSDCLLTDGACLSVCGRLGFDALTPNYG